MTIDIYGYDEEAEYLKKKIFNLFKENALDEELWVNIISSITERRGGKIKGFVRVFAHNHSAYSSKVIKLLKNMSVRIEVVKDKKEISVL